MEAHALLREELGEVTIGDLARLRACLDLLRRCHQHLADADPSAEHPRGLLDQRRSSSLIYLAIDHLQACGASVHKSARRLPLFNRDDVAVGTGS